MNDPFSPEEQKRLRAMLERAERKERPRPGPAMPTISPRTRLLIPGITALGVVIALLVVLPFLPPEARMFGPTVLFLALIAVLVRGFAARRGR